MSALPSHLSFPSQAEAQAIAELLRARGYTVQLDRAYLDTDAPREVVRALWETL